jgi:ABC-type Fe2+-enterobactin transport system substrate-binding protein
VKPARIFAAGAAVVGLGVALLGAVIYSGASIPYQDAPAELLARQAGEIANARIVFLIGLGVAAVGAMGFWRSLARNRKGTN